MTEYPKIEQGLKVRYRDIPELSPVGGQVRVVGATDGNYTDIRDENGDQRDVRNRQAMHPDSFWATFEPVHTPLPEQTYRQQRAALAEVIRDARHTFYDGTTSWGLTFDRFVAERVLNYMEKNS